MNMSSFKAEGDWIGKIIAITGADTEAAEDRVRDEIMAGIRCQSCEQPLAKPMGDTTLCPDCEAL